MTQKETIVYLGDSLELTEYHTPYDLANNTLSYKGIFKPLGVDINITPIRIDRNYRNNYRNI